MVMTRNGGWTDQQILTVLDLVNREDMSASEVARRFGTSRSAICGIIFRLRNDTDAEEARPNTPGDLDYLGAPVAKAENMDGGMPVHWWKHRPGKVSDAGAA